MKTLKVFITGLVQGIFFRKYIQDEAKKIGVKGYVRNLDDGRVEVVVEGKEDEVKAMLRKCEQGAPHSKVDNVEYSEIKHVGFDSFKILSM